MKLQELHDLFTQLNCGYSHAVVARHLANLGFEIDPNVELNADAYLKLLEKV